MTVYNPNNTAGMAGNANALTIPDSGIYQITFGFITTSTLTAQVTLTISGFPTASDQRIICDAGNAAAKFMSSVTTIKSLTAGQTLSLVNTGTAAILIETPAGPAGASVAAYIAIFRLK